MKAPHVLRRAAPVVLAILLILPTISCAKEEVTVTDTTATTQSTTAAVSETAQTEYGHSADADAMSAATEQVPFLDTMLGCWVTPRPHLMTTQEDADARYAELAASGIDMVYSFGDTADPAHMDRMLRAAEKNGVKVMIELGRIADVSGIDANLSLVRATADYPAVIGYNMYDEPNAALFPALGEQLRRIREIVGRDKLIMCNLFPNYANATQLGISGEKDGMTAYQQYLDRFMSDGMLIGCFEWQGKNMYYVVNTSVMEPRVIELSFKQEIKAKVIAGYNEFAFSGAVLNKPLAAGEAMLIIEE